jgi:hypothetical protein
VVKGLLGSWWCYVAPRIQLLGVRLTVRRYVRLRLEEYLVGQESWRLLQQWYCSLPVAVVWRWQGKTLVAMGDWDTIV